MSDLASYDVLVIGCGPAGHGAALAAAAAGKRVAVVDRAPGIGTASMRHPTLPLKVLQHRAIELKRAARITRIDRAVDIAGLEPRVATIVDRAITDLKVELARKAIDLFHARANFLSDHIVQLTTVHGARQRVTAKVIIIATGAQPTVTATVSPDHEYVFDASSILSMRDLPRTLVVAGSGVIAVQFASIFTHLGVRVTMVDPAPKPLPGIEDELVDRFLKSFIKAGGRYLGDTEVTQVRWDGATRVETIVNQGGARLDSDRVLLTGKSDAFVAGLTLEHAGLSLTATNRLRVDRSGCTTLPHVWGAGGVVGSDGLAAHSFQAGRRVARAALGIKEREPELVPLGVHAIPEIASVGLTEDEAKRKHLPVDIGRAELEAVTWSQVTEEGAGLLKLVAEGETGRLLGAHAVGPGATDLIHLGQMAIVGRLTTADLATMPFDFPVYAEIYRTAALDLQRKTRLDLTLSMARPG